MKIDLSCPAELWRYELPRKDYRACDLILYNISDKKITSMEVTLILLDGDKEELARLIHRAHDLKGEKGKTFSANVPVEEEVDFKDVEIIIDKVWFDDQTIWRRGKGDAVAYESNALPNGRRLENLRFLAGPTAVGYPQEQDEVWVCVCGRPNALGQSSCTRCHLSRKDVFDQYSEETVKQLTWQREQRLNLKAKAAREDASVRQAKREEVYNARKKRRCRVVTGVCCTAAALVVAYGTWYHLIPQVKYQLAVKQLQEGQWANAQRAFEEMDGYRSAEEHILRCRYQIALEQMNSDKEKHLQDAKEAFLALGEYEDAKEKITQAEYSLAGLWLKEGKLQAARDQYAALGDYEDCAAQTLHCDYLIAKELLDNKQYDDALEAFNALGDYEDAKALAVQAILLPGEEALASGDYDAALASFEKIAQEAGVAKLIQQAHYKKGEALQEAGDMTAAGNEFLLAGDYENAADRANDCIYLPAVAARDAGNLLQAAELFGKIANYLDAADQQKDCYYRYAVAMLNDTEYTQAQQALAMLPDDYQDVSELKKQCLYLPAQEAYEKKDYQAAIEAYEQLGDYKKSVSNLQKARYALAEQYLDMAVYDQAIALYEQLGDYKESATNLKKAHYQKAEMLLHQGEAAQAEEIYLQLGDYKKSADRVNKIRYDRACALFDAGDIANAREAFAALGKYADAEKMANNCDYITAEAHLAKAEYDEAIALFEALGEYQDAAVRAKEGYYLKGRQLAQDALWLDAAALFLKAGDYNDAAIQAEIMYAGEYQPYEKEAEQFISRKQYDKAASYLAQLDFAALPQQFKHLKDKFDEACLLQGDKLFEAGKPYEALPYYQQIPHNKDAAQRLKSNCYRLLGTWMDQHGTAYEFRLNGTLKMGDEEMFFRVDDFAMSTGTSMAALVATHSVSAVGEKEAILFEITGGKTRQLNLRRAGDYTLKQLPLPEAYVPAAQESADEAEDMTVVDEE